jgi:hypothetical protein
VTWCERSRRERGRDQDHLFGLVWLSSRRRRSLAGCQRDPSIQLCSASHRSASDDTCDLDDILDAQQDGTSDLIKWPPSSVCPMVLGRHVNQRLPPASSMPAASAPIRAVPVDATASREQPGRGAPGPVHVTTWVRTRTSRVRHLVRRGDVGAGSGPRRGVRSNGRDGRPYPRRRPRRTQ